MFYYRLWLMNLPMFISIGGTVFPIKWKFYFTHG